MPAGTQTKADPLRSWARKLARVHSELDAVTFSLIVAAKVRASLRANASGGSLATTSTEMVQEQLLDMAEPPGGWANPWLVGVAHEQAASEADRTSRGAWYTPRSVVEGLVALALVGNNSRPEFIVDPTCGGGAFLLAALDHLVSEGVKPDLAVGSIGGIDIDKGAVTVAQTSIELWALLNNCGPVEPNVVCADALVHYPRDWPRPQAIVGNPPFASPLKSKAENDSAKLFRESRPAMFGPYADTAACHLARAVELIGSKGVVCLVQPVSVLSGRDTEGMRSHFADVAPLEAMWCTREAVFDAGVRVVAPVLTPSAKPESIRLASGVTPTVSRSVRSGSGGTSETWSGLAAQAFGVPPIRLNAKSRLSDISSSTAGFRDEHYGLAAACVERAESESELRLTTVGSIDPLYAWWGQRPTRFAGRLWDKPVIETDRLDAKVGRWVQNQLKPKVVLPTQSKVLEPFIDTVGNIIPATPVLAIHADDHLLHHIAAVLLAPPIVAWALERSFGSAMSLDAVKLSATQIGTLPLPNGTDAWDEAAELLAQTHPETPGDAQELAITVARTMMSAYQLKSSSNQQILEWYKSRFTTGT